MIQILITIIIVFALMVGIIMYPEWKKKKHN